MKFDKKLGFGLMRLPMIKKDNTERVDEIQTSKMVDLFIENGFTYFDTAHGYIDGLSEKAVKTCLTSRYSRDKYILTDKLSDSYFKTEQDIEPFLDSQLSICGVDYFDYYLLHSLCAGNINQYRECNAYKKCLELKKKGKIKHLGFSFHDSADVLEEFLKEMPLIEVVQLQVNYADFESEHVQSRKCVELCRKYNKDIIIMEPVKGGRLANLPKFAEEDFNELRSIDGSEEKTAASFAVRFCAGLENVIMVLSGMSTFEQMKDNVSFMKDFTPLTESENEICLKIGEKMRDKNLIACTGCSYCTAGCPEKIAIPKVFENKNNEYLFGDKADENLRKSAKNCIKCGKCEKICPQHLKIRELLEGV